ncbi:unnamed protein product, partial [Eruca vesicaria subsp. sativa]|nr:unnamed protein product [Eruca vesicaria subsp. sativa]
MNPSIYTCSSLVSLRFEGMSLPNPERVLLPSLKEIVLIVVEYTNQWALEKLISQCPVLENETSENYYMVDLTVNARPLNLLSSLEYVDIERPFKGEALEMALVGYLLEHSPNLKKLSLSLHDSLKKGESVDKLILSLDDAPKKEEPDIFIEL